MKKALAFLLSATMIFTSFVQVFAGETTDSRLEKAISTTKSIIDVPAEYTKFDYSVNSNGGEQIWRLTWSTGKDAKTSGNLSVSIDDTGFISDYYQYSAKSDQYNTSKFPKYSRQSALDAAKAFLEKVQPGLSSKVEEDSDNEKYIGNKNYYFNFHYIENDIPYNGYRYSVNVDGNTLDIRNYYGTKASGVTFPDKTGILGIEDIQKIIVNAKGIELKYLQSYEDEVLKIYPAYSLTKAGSSQYDAFKGGAVTSNTNRIYDGYGASKDMLIGATTEAASTNNLTKQELDAVEKVANVMTKEDAEKKIRAISEINIDDNYTVNYFNLYKNNKNKDQYVWNISFGKNPEKAESNKAIDRNYVNVAIDAVSGSLVSYRSGYYADRTGDNKIDYETAKAAAEKIAKNYESDKFGQTEFYADGSSVKALTADKILPQNTTDYSFTFRRIVNGIPCDSDYIAVGIDGKTGAMKNYTVDWYNGQFPEVAKDKIITMDEAYKNLFDKVGLKLYYVNTAVRDVVYTKSEGQTKPEIKLVYSIDTSKPTVIDAQNGDILDSQGKPYVKKEIKPYTDINGHFSEQAVKILQEYGIGFKTEKFLPDQQIKQVEFMELILKSTDSYFENRVKDENKEKYIYDSLTRRGIIKQEEINPTAQVSREEAVKYIIRTMGFQRVAEIKDIYVSEFTDSADIAPELLGYVCIAKGLNLISGYNNSFLPKETMTRGEAAVLLYNSLK